MTSSYGIAVFQRQPNWSYNFGVIRGIVILVLLSTRITLAQQTAAAVKGADPCRAVSAQRVTIADVKSDTAKYDGLTVSLTGTLHGHHLGVSLVSATDGSIRIVDASDAKAEKRACTDRQYSRLWELASERELPGGELPKYEVAIIGFVRVLKDKDGKPATKFFVFGQWPLELVVLRVLSISPAQN